MIQRRVKLAIFGVKLALSEDFTVRGPNIALMISTITIPENDDSEACSSSLQFAHFRGQNSVKVRISP